MGRVGAFFWKGSLPHFVHTQVREIAVKVSLRSHMDVSQYLLFADGLSALRMLVRRVMFGPIMTVSSSEGLAR